ncbi:leucine-rich repeat-containing protein 17-like [Ptychodera flava]|uniref:leucine-rich repeat-containing protein 17-like n=1 Tax=Ptychodera flava TaxID=63121 RepID=UPI00396AA190
MLMTFSSITSEAGCKVYNFTYVDCRYRNLTIVPRNLPSTTTHLDLSYNYITSLTPNSFENLRSLEELIIRTYDHLYIDSETFVGLKKLRKLDFLDSGPVSFGKDTFRHLQSLQVLEILIMTFPNMAESLFNKLINLSELVLGVHVADLSSEHPASKLSPLIQGAQQEQTM